ncbi:HTTM domain-containing protein [Rubinisphaera margarita]|uniref:HTTM domain-containing protein n=1 Tax=Rubinisphaera margarita TaxID=2909586 RepID=UPI001EE7BDB5|nr:HTTM domain-containing protein [Rubinisphaera margarita]MCG6158511.1 HTTM domain-containing protein [Rubinisphaera margarita]
MATDTVQTTSWTQAFNEFFFARQVPYGMALMRISLTAVMLFVMGSRWTRVRELFSADGAAAPLADNFGFFNFLPLMSGPVAVTCYTFMLLAMVLLIVGWKTRLAATSVFILFTYFTLQDSLSTITKYSVIASHGFMLLAISQCGAVWSVDRWLELKRQGVKAPLRLLGTGRAVEMWPQRLVQIFIGFVYFGAAITKLQTSTFFTGDQLRFWLLSNVNHYNPVGELFSAYPALLIPGGYVTIIWEIAFLFAVWQKRMRIPMLLLGAMFHGMTTLLLGLFIFPLVCISIYLAFTTPNDIQNLRAFGAGLSRRYPALQTLLRIPHRATVAIGEGCLRLGTRGLVPVCLAVIAAGLYFEHSADRFGTRRAEGRYQLQPLSHEQAMTMLRTHDQIREEDKLLSLDIGNWMIGGRVTEFGTTFEAGDFLMVQANMIPPFDDLYLKCDLHNSRGGVMQQIEGALTRENFRYTFGYHLPTDLAAGEYQFVLNCNNVEIARRTITVKNDEDTSVAAR